MNRRRGKTNAMKAPQVMECVNVAVKVLLDKFLADENETELKFPSCFSAVERAYVHKRVATLGLKSKSRGKGMNRYLTVYKRAGSTIIQNDARLTLDPQMREAITDLLKTYPITTRERDELCNAVEIDRNRQNNHKVMGCLNNGNPQVPTTTYNRDLIQFRSNLPVFPQRKQIIEGIMSNQVVVIAGETGSGKTTQIPQLVLEQCQLEGKHCRIYCTQPRRMSAISVAERVAFERNDKIGQSIGYQIRLESRMSPKTVLMYCTTGVLLRTLMSGDNSLSNVTHVFVDEVHERDKFSDFLLIALRENLAKYKDLKLILMSATIDVQLFSKYFYNCPVINIPGRMYDVQKFYLEDILSILKYKSEAMQAVEIKLKSGAQETSTTAANLAEAMISANTTPQEIEKATPEVELEPDLQTDMDGFLEECYKEGSLDSFAQILYMYISEGIPPDCKESKSGITGLMAAAHHGLIETAHQIIKIGADAQIKDLSGKTAYDHALNNGKTECAEYLKSVGANNDITPITENGSSEISVADLLNLKLYNLATPDEGVDHDLILAVIKHIHLKLPKGSILIFLPGYDDIVTLKDQILLSNDMSIIKYQIFTLHSNMQTSDQKKVFAPLPNIRKIILSTNIAETSITIDDVVYVVDSCKVKEKFYESSAGVSSLQCVWTSKAGIKQRAGRAGRTQPGKGFILCSRTRFNALPENSVPEILRVPLQELCLHTKQLTLHNTPIADFLLKALEPPSLVAVRNSVSLLKTIGALTPTEELTEIGYHLLNLAIEPKLGKMLLYACVMKCLDPVLTIVCSLAYKEPFQLPSIPAHRKLSKAARKSFSADALSDHMALLRAFQAWQDAKTNGSDRAFCSKNYICGPTMEMISQSRTQLLTQLRAEGFVKPKGQGDIKDVNLNSEKWQVVKAVLASGLYPSIARVDRDSMTLRTSKEVKVAFHPSSTLHSDAGRSASKKQISELPSDWLVFEEISRIGRFCFLRCNTSVTPLTVALFAGPLRLPPEALTQKANYSGLSSDSDSDNDERIIPDISCLMIDDWAIFSATAEDALNIYLFRQRFCALIIKKMNAPQKNSTQMDECILNTMVNILAWEEKNVGLVQPPGIGQRPRFVTDHQRMQQDFNMQHRGGNFMNTNNFYHSGQYFNPRMPQQPYLFNQQGFAPNAMRTLASPSPGNMLSINTENNIVIPDAKFFMVKVDGVESVEESQKSGLWQFNYNTDKKILKTVRSGIKAVLFFSTIGGINMFVGCAHLSPGNLRADQSSTLEWISTQHIPHFVTRHLNNTFNENKKVSASRDGQEISPDSGKRLYTLFKQPPKRQQNRNNGNRPVQKQNNV